MLHTIAYLNARFYGYEQPADIPILQNLLPELQRQLLYNHFAEFRSYRGKGCKYTGNHIGDLIVTGINKNV